MFERSGASKRSVAGILPSSTSKTDHRPASSGILRPTDITFTNHKLQEGSPALKEDASSSNNKRPSGHLRRHVGALKRVKEDESEEKAVGGNGGGKGVRGVKGRGGLGRGRENGGPGGRGWGGEESVGGGGSGDKGAADENHLGVNSLKDQNKLLLSDSSENSEEEWNDRSDDDNDLALGFSPSTSSHAHHHRGRNNLLKKTHRHKSASKRRPEEDVDGDGGEISLCAVGMVVLCG